VLQLHSKDQHALAIDTFHATRPSAHNIKLAAWATDTKPLPVPAKSGDEVVPTGAEGTRRRFDGMSH
jgi:hypothetical protein